MNALAAERAVQPRSPEAPRVLSIGQERLWYLEQLAPGSPVYNMPFVSSLRGTIHVDAFERALELIVQRHEVLRTAILPLRGVPRPAVLPKGKPRFELFDLRASPDPQREAQEAITRQATQPFNLVRGPWLRCALLQLSSDEYLFVHTAPHLVFEGSSIAILYGELSHIYAALVQNEPVSLPSLALQYSDFADWQRKQLTGAYEQDLRQYWKGQLSGAPALQLRSDFKRPDVQSTAGRRYFFSLPPDLLLKARGVFEQSGISRYCGLLTAFYVFLYRRSGQTDLSVGSPFRPRCTGIEELIGFFVNTVVLRAQLSLQHSFADALRSVNQILRAAIAHSDLTLDRVVEAVGASRDPSRTPLFQANFRAPKSQYPRLALPGVVADRARYVDNGTAKFDIALEIDSTTGEACYFEYCTALFTERTIAEAALQYEQLLNQLVESPEESLESICAR